MAKAPVAKVTKKGFDKKNLWWIIPAGILVLLFVVPFVIWGMRGAVKGSLSLYQKAFGLTPIVVDDPVVDDPVVDDPVVDDPVIDDPVVDDCTSYTVDLGILGKYHGVYDSDHDVCTLGIWETSVVREGQGLYAWKETAMSVTFVMPFDGTINNSADYIEVDGILWIPGNPAVDPDNKEPLVLAGTTVTIWTDGPNDSAGFQLWEKND